MEYKQNTRPSSVILKDTMCGPHISTISHATTYRDATEPNIWISHLPVLLTSTTNAIKLIEQNMSVPQPPTSLPQKAVSHTVNPAQYESVELKVHNIPKPSPEANIAWLKDILNKLPNISVLPLPLPFGNTDDEVIRLDVTKLDVTKGDPGSGRDRKSLLIRFDADEHINGTADHRLLEALIPALANHEDPVEATWSASNSVDHSKWLNASWMPNTYPEEKLTDEEAWAHIAKEFEQKGYTGDCWGNLEKGKSYTGYLSHYASVVSPQTAKALISDSPHSHPKFDIVFSQYTRVIIPSSCTTLALWTAQSRISVGTATIHLDNLASMFNDKNPRNKGWFYDTHFQQGGDFLVTNASNM